MVKVYVLFVKRYVKHFQMMSATSPPNRVASPKTMVNENSCMNSVTPSTTKMKCLGNGPQYDPRSDLLKAIRDGRFTKFFSRASSVTRAV